MDPYIATEGGLSSDNLMQGPRVRMPLLVGSVCQGQFKKPVRLCLLTV